MTRLRTTPFTENSKMVVQQEPFTDEFKKYLNNVTDHFHTPSISIGVVDGEKRFTHVQGDAVLPDTHATEDTLYYLASVTKSFTATTLLSLLHERQQANLDVEPINLDTKIASILPGDFKLPCDYASSHATLGDALGHLLGTGPHNFHYGGEGYTVQDAVKSLRHLKMTAELRQKHQYLNVGYMLIQHVIEVLTGEEIAVSHHKYIWDPLGMTSTFIKREDAVAASNTLAEGYSWDPLEDELNNAPIPHDYPLVGGGGLIISIKDLTTYLDAVIHNRFNLPDDAYKQLFKPRAIDSESPYKHHSTILYALGWNIMTYRGHRMITHSGGITGFSSKLAFLPDQKWGVALLANADGGGYWSIETALYRLIDDHLGVSPDKRQDIVPIHDSRTQQGVDFYLNTRSRLYPKVPEPPLPLGLPLSAFAGSYHNPAYRTLTLKVVTPRDGLPVHERTKEVLHAEIHRLVDVSLDVEHVSGTHYIAWIHSLDKPNMVVSSGFRSRFEVGSDGSVQRWAVNWDPAAEEGDEGMLVWFDKVS